MKEWGGGVVVVVLLWLLGYMQGSSTGSSVCGDSQKQFNGGGCCFTLATSIHAGLVQKFSLW